MGIKLESFIHENIVEILNRNVLVPKELGQVTSCSALWKHQTYFIMVLDNATKPQTRWGYINLYLCCDYSFNKLI